MSFRSSNKKRRTISIGSADLTAEEEIGFPPRKRGHPVYRMRGLDDTAQRSAAISRSDTRGVGVRAEDRIHTVENVRGSFERCKRNARPRISVSPEANVERRRDVEPSSKVPTRPNEMNNLLPVTTAEYFDTMDESPAQIPCTVSHHGTKIASVRKPRMIPIDDSSDSDKRGGHSPDPLVTKAAGDSHPPIASNVRFHHRPIINTTTRRNLIISSDSDSDMEDRSPSSLPTYTTLRATQMDSARARTTMRDPEKVTKSLARGRMLYFGSESKESSSDDDEVLSGCSTDREGNGIDKNCAPTGGTCSRGVDVDAGQETNDDATRAGRYHSAIPSSNESSPSSSSVDLHYNSSNGNRRHRFRVTPIRSVQDRCPSAASPAMQADQDHQARLRLRGSERRMILHIDSEDSDRVDDDAAEEHIVVEAAASDVRQSGTTDRRISGRERRMILHSDSGDSDRAEDDDEEEQGEARLVGPMFAERDRVIVGSTSASQARESETLIASDKQAFSPFGDDPYGTTTASVMGDIPGGPSCPSGQDVHRDSFHSNDVTARPHECLPAPIGKDGARSRTQSVEEQIMDHLQAELQAVRVDVDQEPDALDAEELKGRGLAALLSEEDELAMVEWDRQRRIIRKRAIRYLESLPLQILSQLVDCLSVENDRLCSLGGDAVSSSEDEGVVGASRGRSGGSTARAKEMAIDLVDRKTGFPKKTRFPLRTREGTVPSSTRLARLMRIAEILHEALVQDLVITKRDVYYQDVNLFGRQAVVDELVDDLAVSGDFRRSDLNVCASAKGLIAGAGVSILTRRGELIELSSSRGTLIPPGDTIWRFVARTPPIWILIVEKDAVFQTLCSSGLVDDQELGPGLIITGKGFPDLSTLQLVRLLADTYPSAILGALMDADPSGLSILSVYRDGSKASRYSLDTKGLALGERLKWLGVRLSDWSSLGLDVDLLQPLTTRDATLARAMLRDDRICRFEGVRQELQDMLHLRKKAEIQILSGARVESGPVSQPCAGSQIGHRGSVDVGGRPDTEPSGLGLPLDGVSDFEGSITEDRVPENADKLEKVIDLFVEYASKDLRPETARPTTRHLSPAQSASSTLFNELNRTLGSSLRIAPCDCNNGRARHRLASVDPMTIPVSEQDDGSQDVEMHWIREGDSAAFELDGRDEEEDDDGRGELDRRARASRENGLIVYLKRKILGSIRTS